MGKAAQLHGTGEQNIRQLLLEFGSAEPDASVAAAKLRRAVQAAFGTRRRR